MPVLGRSFRRAQKYQDRQDPDRYGTTGARALPRPVSQGRSLQFHFPALAIVELEVPVRLLVVGEQAGLGVIKQLAFHPDGG